ncbi:SDR family oxidoreductase [Maritimibacter sp. UBA3975]|uniref:SDR family oxidoreductase n=1 Tax=Maritimibacter sp. UBA3975 TaxID=1946833 RepID=UPI000C0B2F11|nr:SDR family oxidoreductase [Maritimibacter sp. UBA3975]MAM62207.1 3-beta hydroxysteroid dehydrogenase [Maritimibacter sp.]
MGNVLIAGATGYLGSYLCAEYARRGWYVSALVRSRSRAKGLAADTLIEAEATDPASLVGVMEGVDLVVSALGITRQADGLGYRDVDYQANLNLLREAEAANVPRFAYVHVLNADKMRGVPLVDAKSDFVAALQTAEIASTVIAPSGYFSDMEDFLAMAQQGRVWLFGDGALRINPIHGADLAGAVADAVDAGTPWLDVGGPDIFTHRDLAALACEVAGRPARITCLPDGLRRMTLAVLPKITPRRIGGPVAFFLTALGVEMVGEPRGTRRLRDHFAERISGASHST